MFTQDQLDKLANAIREKANQDGHPDEWDVRAALPGLSPELSEKAFAVLSQSDEFLPTETGLAVAKWLRLCSEFSQ